MSLKKSSSEIFELLLQGIKLSAQRPGNSKDCSQAFVTSKDQKIDWYDMIFLKTLLSLGT